MDFKEHLFTRMEYVAGQVEELEALCLFNDPECGVEEMSLDIIDSIANMVTQSTKECPCCGEATICEEDTSIHFGHIDLEAQEGQARATLYVEHNIESMSDWVDTKNPPELSPLDVVEALRNLADKLELKFKESGKEA